MGYKANGTRIKNPSAFVAKFEADRDGPVFNSRMQEIKNPVAYVAKMLQNEKKKGARLGMVPTSTDGKLSYYGKSPGMSLAQRLKSTLASSLRGAGRKKRQKAGDSVSA